MDRQPLPPSGRHASALVLAGVALAAGLIGGGLVAAIDRSQGTRTVDVVTTVASPSAVRKASAQDRAPAFTINQLYRRAGPGVVQVTASPGAQNRSSAPGFTPPDNRPVSHGSGFVLNTDGYILTNDHLVERSDRVTVSFSNQDNVPATIVGADPTTDLALLKVDLPASALHPVLLGNSDTARVGDPVVAIGNPYGFDRTVTAGIVSAVQRLITAPSGFTIENAIQTDAPIGKRSSGGPLIDARGTVIGINAQPLTGTAAGGSGVGFAIPVNVAKKVIGQLRSTGSVAHAWLGVDGADIDANLARNARLAASKGVLVEAVVPGSPAAELLRTGSTAAVLNGTTYCLGGDVITTLEGRALSGYEQLTRAVAARAPGDPLSLTVAHPDGSVTKLRVVLGKQPSQTRDARSACSPS